jgi:hypothetical protein
MTKMRDLHGTAKEAAEKVILKLARSSRAKALVLFSTRYGATKVVP